MSSTRVAVVASHSLFGEGIATLLRSDRRLRVLRIDAHAGDCEQKLKAFQPEVVVLEVPEGATMWDALPGISPRLYICVRMGGSAAEVYRDRRIILAQPEEIIEAIHQGTRKASAASGSQSIRSA